METKIITEKQLALAIEAVRAKNTIAFKTDTIYGLSCLSTSETACNNLAKIKGREGKPLILLISKNTDLSQYIGAVSSTAKKVMDKFWPGPLTIIFPLKYPFCDTITCGNSTIAIRMPDDGLCEKLISAVGEPIVSTSANLSGEKPLNSPDSIFETFKGKIPYIIDSGLPKTTSSSTIISIDGENISILREGAISKEDIFSLIS